MVTWNSEMIREFGIYKYVIWPFGTWPINVNRHFARLRMIATCILLGTMVVDMATGALLGQFEDVNAAVDGLGFMVCGCLVIGKVLLLRHHEDHLSTIMHHAATDWSNELPHHYRQIMRRYVSMGRFIFFFQIGFSYLTIVAVNLRPLSIPDTLLSGNSSLYMENQTVVYARPLPLGTICIYRDDQDTVCTVRYLLHTIQSMSNCIAHLGTDVFLYGLGFHLCGQFELLQQDMTKFGETEGPGEERKVMIELVRRHCLLLDLASRLEITVRLMLLMQLFMTGLHTCLIGIQFMYNMKAHDVPLMVRTVVSFGVLLLQLFLYCYMGESLSSRIAEISETVYLCQWPSLTNRTIKDLSFIMARAGVPFHITAGSFYHANLDSFKNIMKVSFSYFSVLQLMLEG